ncbi:TPA: helix-turn-helix domain-containing protein, partial [Pseudomonas aeruginosa]|nr:helix-turn-helix domain-containing protein [Pseudomonas aeruginosa]
MSTIIMSACWPLQGLTPAQKAVLISLADNANDEG